MKLNNFITSFKIPLIVLIGIILYLVLLFFKTGYKELFILVIIALGSYELFKDTLGALLRKQFALDYIAILAIIVSVATGEYLVAAVIALMISSGRTLEDYGVAQAKKSLTKLVDRIPNDITLWENGKAGRKEKISNVKTGEEVLVKRGEVIGLDGILTSQSALTDESSLTGEPYLMEKFEGDQIRSGTINVGDVIIIKVTSTQENSTYNKIIEMVKNAQGEKAPLIRLADKYSTIFTLITAVIAGFAYIISGNLHQVLAVLVIATPCPLILATPIALMGGVSASAKKRVIVKKLASIEALSRAKAFIFDKTGTITLGEPKLVEYSNLSNLKDNELLGIAEAIERNSLHPLAKAVVAFAREKNASVFSSKKVSEKIGSGISGFVNGKTYTLKKGEEEGMLIELFQEKSKIGIFKFEDEIKEDSKEIIKALKKMGIEIHIFTGDKKEAAEKVVRLLGESINLKAECKPEDKQEGIKELKKEGKITAMVGDGINDAPALALADVGIVFSNEEQTAASEAADIVFLGNDFSLVLDSFKISKGTIDIALQSILWGIGISIGGMVFASVGLIPPLIGAVLQEAIDVAVIINALRASRL